MIFEQLKRLIHSNSQVGTASWMDIFYDSICDLIMKIASVVDWIGKCKGNLNIVFITKVSQCKSDSTWDKLISLQLVNKLDYFVCKAI